MKNTRQLGKLGTYDVRAKLYILILFVINTLITWSWTGLLLNFLEALLIIALSGTKLNSYLVKIRITLMFELIICCVLFFVIPVKFAFFILVKILAITFVYNSIMRTISQSKLLDGLTKGFGLNAKGSLRCYYLTGLMLSADGERIRVRRAQRARGVDPKGGNFFARVNRDIVVTVPNIARAFRRIKRNKQAINMRDYVKASRRKAVSPLAFTWVDHVMLCVFLAFIVLSALLILLK